MSKGIISFPSSRPFSGHQGALDMALQIPLTLVRLQLCLSAHTLNQLCRSQRGSVNQPLKIDDNSFWASLSVCTCMSSLRCMSISVGQLSDKKDLPVQQYIKTNTYCVCITVWFLFISKTQFKIEKKRKINYLVTVLCSILGRLCYVTLLNSTSLKSFKWSPFKKSSYNTWDLRCNKDQG